MPDGPLIIKNKYRILRQIAQGGMGSVYEVLHERLGVTRALKQVRVDLQGNPEAERRFLTEAQMMARLEHPNIVRVYDIDYEPDFGTFLLMELIRGPDLGKVLRKEGRLGFAETLRIGRGMARALDYAHRHQLVHRDIKPANVIIEEGSGRVVVTDFGIAKQVESAENTLTSENTRTGAFLGTYRYSSREQIRNEKGVRIDGRADVYSLGAVLYEMYSGLRYLHGMSEPEITAFVGYQPNWTPPLEFPEPPPDDFRELIERCLATNRDERVASAAEVVTRIEACSARLLDPAARAIVLTDVDTPPITAAPSGGGTVEGSLAGLSVGTQSTISPAEPRDESRAQWVSLIQTLRESVDSQASDFERLLKELIELDIPRDEYRQLDDMSQILHRVESAEGAGEFAGAASSLEDLSERLSSINVQIAERLRSTLSGAVEELERGWKALLADAGEFVAADQSTQFERLLGSSQRLIASQNWAGCRKSLLDGTAVLDRARQGARQAATDAVGDAVRAIGARFAELTARSAESARGLGFEPAQVEKELAAAIAEGKVLVAKRRAEEALARVGDALGRVEGEERARIAKLRSELEALLARIDLGAARALAPADLESANEARRAAVGAEEAQQIGPALAAYARAIELFGAVHETLQQHQAAEITIAERELEAVVQRAGEAPTEVVAAPLDAARLALRGTRPTQHGAAVAALRDARATLAKALEEAPLFSEASAAEAKAAALRDRLRAELEDPAVLGPGERRLAQGRAALARREWRGARDRFTQALESFRAFEGELGRRQLETRLASARQAFSEELAAIDSPLAREHSKRALAGVDRLAERAQQSERAGDLDAARDSYEAARAALGKVRDESTAVLGRLLVELGEGWQRTGEAAGGFVEAPARARIEPGLENARQALTRGALGEAARLLAETREQIDAELRDATRRASSLVEETVRSTRARLAELASRAPERAARLGVDPSSLEAEIARLIGAQRLQAAADRAEQAATLVRSAFDAQVRDEEAGELAEATHQLRVMLAEAAGAPAEIVGAAIRRTETLLSASTPAAHGEAMAALRGARSELARALDSASLYQAARKEQEAARAAHDRARALAPSPGEIAPLEKLIADADARLERRNFRAARDGHALARERLAALERELLARRDAQQIEVARSSAARALAELEPAWARALVPEESARAARAAEAAAALERAGDQRAAAAAFREALELATEASGRMRALVEASLADLRDAWRILAERAGTELIDEAESTTVLRTLEDAARALERGALAEAHQIELSLRAGLKETGARVARGAEEAAARALDDLTEHERKLRTYSEETLRRTGIAFETTRDEVTRLLVEARFADAVARARAAAATVAEALDRELAAERGGATTARELLARAMAGLDAPLAEQLAADDLALARAALARGREAEERADYQGATREYTAGSVAAEQVRAALAERAERDRAALAGIRGRFDQAFDTLDLDWAREIAAHDLERVRRARGEADAADARGDRAAAIVTLQDAVATLDRVLEAIRGHVAARLADESAKLRGVLERASAAPPAIVAAPRERAEAALARAGSSGPSTPRTALRELEDCRTQLERAIEESREHRRASDARDAARAAQARALALKPSRRRLKAPSRMIDDAESAFTARRWTKAREGYVQATAALTALERELAGSAAVARARVAPGPAAAPSDAWSEAPTVGVSRAPARVVPPRPRQPWVVTGAAAAAIVLALVLARVSGLWSPAAQRSETVTAATPAPAREAPEVAVKQGPAPGAPPVEAPAPGAVAEAPVAALPAPTAAVATRPVESAPPAVAALPPPSVPRIARFSPRENLVPVPAGASRTFALELTPAGAGKPSIEWRLDGSVVARDVTEWKFQARPSATGAPQELQARVGDGTGEDQLHLWKISIEPLPAPKPEPLRLEWRPERLDRLPYQQAQEFELVAPPGSAAGLDYSWTLDGRKVASGPRFSLPNADARLVGRGPVEIAALARDASGRTFSHKWSFRVDPPAAPELTGSTPSAGTVPAEQGATLSFELAAANPAPGQALSYVFEVDRKPSASQSPRLPYTLNDENEHTIVGYIEDNFRQRSKRQMTWTIPASSGIVTKVQSWLADYERAWNSRDSRRLASLRGMSTADADKLQETLAQQKGLKVTFTDIRIQKIDARTAKATYSRTDEFDSVPMNGEHVKRTRPVEQTFTLDGGVVRPQWEQKE